MIFDAKKELERSEVQMIISSLSTQDKKIIAKLLDNNKDNLKITFDDIKKLMLIPAMLPQDVVSDMIKGMINNSQSKIEKRLPDIKKLIRKDDLELINKLSFLPEWLKVMLNE